MKITKVNASKNYDILIERGIIKKCGEYIKKIFPSSKVLVVTDNNVDKFYSVPVIESLNASGIEAEKYVFTAGEENKNLSTVEAITEYAAELKMTRSDIFVALGGGICGDITGFAAASFLRGISFIQIPTTLLAAVDSSVGGKTGVNLKSGKNLIGAFHQPSLVLTDPDTFETLDEPYYLDGIAESVKYGILTDEKLFEMFSKDTKSNIEEIIRICTKIKSDIVGEDEFDTGKRMLLNLGHTFGHSIEKLSNYKITHGHAVAIGMVIAAKVSEKAGFCQKETVDRIKYMLEKNSLPTNCPFTNEELISIALNDKKRAWNMVTLILPEKIGKCILYKTEVSQLEKLLA